MSEQSATPVEWFQASGRTVGVLILVLWAVVAGFAIADGWHPALLGALLVAAVLTHVTMLRPRVGTTRDDLVYREMYTDLAIPLVAVDEMGVTRYFHVTAAGQHYISPAVGRSRKAARSNADRDPRTVYADLVEDTVRARIADARARRSVVPTPQVRRTWAWPEIVATALAVVVFVIGLAA